MPSSKLERLLTRLFPMDDIRCRPDSLPYLFRWKLLALDNGISAYLHHFVGSDWERDLHDHPKTFISIGLKGGYVEEEMTFFDRGNYLAWLRQRRQYRAPWARRFPPRHIHRLRVPPRGCWTLVLTGRTKRAWGFWSGAKWTPWREFLSKSGCCLLLAIGLAGCSASREDVIAACGQPRDTVTWFHCCQKTKGFRMPDTQSLKCMFWIEEAGLDNP